MKSKIIKNIVQVSKIFNFAAVNYPWMGSSITFICLGWYWIIEVVLVVTLESSYCVLTYIWSVILIYIYLSLILSILCLLQISETKQIEHQKRFLRITFYIDWNLFPLKDGSKLPPPLNLFLSRSTYEKSRRLFAIL